jgi:hypothetical protein
MFSVRIIPGCSAMALVLASLIGCGTESHVSPTESVSPPVARGIDVTNTSATNKGGWQEFYPLQVGYRWNYVANVSLSHGPGSEPLEERRIENWEIIGTEDLFGRTYFVQRQVVELQSPLGDREYTWWVRYRQDRSGLYEADVCLSDPPGGGDDCSDLRQQRLAGDGSATGEDREAFLHLKALRESIMQAARGSYSKYSGLSVSELDEPLPDHPDLIRLLYPMHPGTDWFIRPELAFHSEIQSLDVVTVPAGRYSAWRVSITPPGFGPNDVAHFWWARSGLVKVLVHIEDPWFGTYDEVMELQPYTLAIY